MTYWSIVKNIVWKSDVVLFIIDARMPELSRNEALEFMVKRMKKKLFFVFNKMDLVSKEHLEYLREKYRHAFFVSGSRNLGMSKLRTAILIAAKREKIENPVVGVVGYPNVGKSAIINALAHRAKAKISPIAGTTKGVQIIKAGPLQVLDSPGVFPYGEKETSLGLIAARNPEELKNPERLACKIIEMFMQKNRGALEKFYNFEIGEKFDSYEIMLQIGQARRMLMKGGVTDEHRTAIQIIRDWQTGRLRL